MGEFYLFAACLVACGHTSKGEMAMDEMLSRFEPGHLIAIVAVVGGILCGMVGIVMGVWLEMRKVASSTALKQDMLSRGMSAEEIRMVIDTDMKRCGSSHMAKSGR